MSSKYKWTFQSNDIISKLRVLEESSLKNLNLNFGLDVKLLLVFNYLQSNGLLLFMIECLEYLSERATA